jgi:uncharacterized protein YaiI (UPF0178 family)
VIFLLYRIARSSNVSIESQEHAPSIRIWIDADACPGAIKELVFRASRRQQIPVCLVANRAMYIPPLSWVTCVRVASEPDAADRYIVQHVAPHDLVITDDIPLAAAVVDKQALAISPRGEVYTAANVQERLATRNLMQQLRASGLTLGGPASLSAADCQRFAAALDRSLTTLRKAKTPP